MEAIDKFIIGKLSSMYLHAWKMGLKTTYYLRSRPATKINKATVGVVTTVTPVQAAPAAPKKEYSDAEAIACSLENPEACEACT
jgi:ribonucleoside-diphosphate reductase alpha chain